MADTKKEAAETPKTLQFLFQEASEYRIVAANAVWGGITIRGDLQLDFCVDNTTIPDTVEHEIDASGHLGKELGRFPPDRSITRTRQVGVVMALDTAENIAKFILERIDQAKTALKEAEDKKAAQ